MRTGMKLLYAFGMLAAGCSPLRNAERAVTGVGGVLLSNLKFPMVFRHYDSRGFGTKLDPSGYRRLLAAEPQDCTESSAPFHDDPMFDRFSEFEYGPDTRDTLVVVSISDGGSRAGIFAAHVMAQLERKYDEIRACGSASDRRAARSLCDDESFARRIHAFSTVSGGSLYAFFGSSPKSVPA